MFAFLIPFLILGCASSNGHRVYDDDGGAHLAVSLRLAARENGFDGHVVSDKHGIAHIAGADDRSAFFAQGFVHAYYRLSQMEIASRTVEGTRSEIVGSSAVKSDKVCLSIGLDRVAERVNERIRADVQTREAVDAYVKGVNAWISLVEADTVPLEFQRAKKKPRFFQSIDVARILTFVSWTLSDPADELKLSRTRAELRPDIFETLFPWPGSDGERGVFNSTAQVAPRKAPAVPVTVEDIPVDFGFDTPLKVPQNTGSNAFILQPPRTENDAILLAHDFHALYLLPSSFMPIQLVSDSFNVIGSSIPGVPGIATGTNGFVAWAYVSSMSDTYDWYRLETDPSRSEFYKWDGHWKKFDEEKVIIRPFDGEPTTIVRKRSEAGEMVPAFHSSKGVTDLAFRWAGRDGRNFLLPFLRRMKIRSAKDCGSYESLENSAAYLLTCVDRENRKGVWLMSSFPKRPSHQDPRVVMNAYGSKDIWTSFFSASENPADFPRNSDVVLANQFSRSKLKEPYVGWLFAPPDRTNRITSLIANGSSGDQARWNFESVAMVNSDITSARVEAIRPIFNEIGQRYVMNKSAGASVCAKDLLKEVMAWDGKFDAQSFRPRLMNYWLYRTELNVWENVIGPSTGHKWPHGWVIVDLITKSPKSSFWDRRQTKEKETRNEIVQQSLEETCKRFGGSKNFKNHTWGSISKPVFKTIHGLQFPNLRGLAPSGSGTTPFLQAMTMGTVYRSVVSLDKTVRFWTITVGGISGDSSSPRAGDWFPNWAGRLMFESPYMSQEEIRKVSGHD